jgi:hypothetical protein
MPCSTALSPHPQAKSMATAKTTTMRNKLVLSKHTGLPFQSGTTFEARKSCRKWNQSIMYIPNGVRVMGFVYYISFSIFDFLCKITESVASSASIVPIDSTVKMNLSWDGSTESQWSSLFSMGAVPICVCLFEM